MPLGLGRVGVTARLGGLAEGKLALLQLAAHQVQEKPGRLIRL